jgi:transposase InsO family protein
VPLGRNDNVATFSLANGFKSFKAFCAEAEVDYQQEQAGPIIAIPSQSVNDDEESDNDEVAEDDPSIKNERSPSKEEEDSRWPHTVDFDLDGASGKSRPIIVEDEEDVQPTNLAAEMLWIHHQCGHISFARIQEMAELGIIPTRLAKYPVPTCSACLYAKATRRKWRSKTANNRDEATEPSKPSDYVSVDQLKLPTPGLIAQLSGFLTTKRYGYATVYIDHASRLGFVYLQKGTTADETLEGKIALEQYSKDRGVTIQTYYHADNRIFRAHKWVEACKNKGQSLTFAGVNAHHQNGMAERRIRTLQEHARTMLIHANQRWPKCVTANLWPYTLRMANAVLNETPNMLDKQRRTSQQIF